MNVLTEIIETADSIMGTLEESEFFNQYLFCDPMELRREIEIQMQRNWEQEGDFYMSDNQFINIVEIVSKRGIESALIGAIEKGLVVIDSIDKNGDLLYALNPDITIVDMGTVNLN